MASELAAFQAVATTYSLTKAQAATYFVAVILSTDPTSLGLSTTPNPGNPGGLSDQQTYINQFNAATNRAIVSGNFANQSATASNLNYPVAGPTTNTGFIGADNSLIGVTNLTSTVVTAESQISAAAAANNPALITGQGGSAGSTYVLTTAVDIIDATSGNSTVIGSFSDTIQAADQINMTGVGNTFQWYGTYDSSKVPLTLTNMQTIDYKVAADAALNWSGITLAANGVQNFIISNSSAISGRTVTTGTNQTLTLASGSAGTVNAGTLTWQGSNIDTSQKLYLKGYQFIDGGTPGALTVASTSAQTLNISSTTNKNKISTLTVGATTNKVVITGDQNFTVSTDLVSSGGATIIDTVDASAATGGVSVTFAAITNALFKFTGGSGNDTVKFADNEFGTLTSGSQLDGGAGTRDKIGILDTALTAAEYANINAAKNFEFLGLNAAITVDASQLTNIKNFSLDTNAAQVITNMTAGAEVDITAAHAAAVTLSGAVGVQSLNLVLGTSSSSSFTVGGAVNIAQTQVVLTSQGQPSGSTNTITTLTNADNSTYTIVGASNLTITNATEAVTIGSKYDASGLTGKLVIVGNDTAFSAGSSLGDIIIGGSNNDTLTASVNSGTLTGNAGIDAFGVAATLAGTTTTGTWAFTTITGLEKTETIQLLDNGTPVFTTAKLDVSGAATLNDAVNTACAGDGSLNAIVKWFQYSGNTYIVDDVSASGALAAGDNVVKISGLVDLSTSTVSSGALFQYL